MSRLISLGRNRSSVFRQIILASEAGAALTIAAAAIKFAPFRHAIGLGSIGRSRRAMEPRPEVLAQLRRSVEWTARRLPWRLVCFQKGLALQWMLRRRGIDARLHYGIGKDDHDALCGHVWITVGDVVLMGGEQAPRFRAVAIYPS